jgi:hypothetical protein
MAIVGSAIRSAGASGIVFLSAGKRYGEKSRQDNELFHFYLVS